MSDPHSTADLHSHGTSDSENKSLSLVTKIILVVAIVIVCIISWVLWKQHKNTSTYPTSVSTQKILPQTAELIRESDYFENGGDGPFAVPITKKVTIELNQESTTMSASGAMYYDGILLNPDELETKLSYQRYITLEPKDKNCTIFFTKTKN